MDLTEFLLIQVQPKPGLYLFQNKLLYLKIFVTGYSFAIQNSHIDLKKDRFLNNFSDWFITKMGLRKDSMWYPIILEECDGSEEKALNRFFEYLKQFDIETNHP